MATHVSEGYIHTVDLNQFPEIQQIFSLYPSLYGFPISLPDNDGDDFLLDGEDNPAVKAVKNTKIHLNDNKNASFVCAVHLHPCNGNLFIILKFIRT